MKKEEKKTFRIFLNGRFYTLSFSELEKLRKKNKDKGIEYAFVLEKVSDNDIRYLKDMGILP